MNTKDKALSNKRSRVKSFKKDEEKGIKEYEKAINKSKGKEKETYKEILPQEEKHLQKIRKI